MSDESADALWAKIGTGTYPQDAHSVVCHLTDVGEVARHLWNELFTDRVRRRWSGRLGLSEEDAGWWIAFWVALHDLGKATPVFQNHPRVVGVRERLVSLGLECRPASTVPHGIMSTALIADEELPGLSALDADFRRRIAVAVGGHHGTFPQTIQWSDLSSRTLGGESWRTVRRTIVGRLAEGWGLATAAVPQAPAGNDQEFYWFLAGLTATADWLGSARRYFPPRGCGSHLPDYRRQAGEQAERALHELGWVAWRPERTAAASFRDLFGFAPRPLQRTCEELADADPRLVVIEAPMGEGKTEAALFLADRALHGGGGRGLYFALPTTASGNQMFGRLCRFLERRYAAQTVNIHLLHGQAVLSDEYQAARRAAEELRQGTRLFDVRDDDASERGGIVAEAWFAANSKQALLAPFGVGTIDQALLAVLQTKHMFVRLFALAGKTLVIDEVHAYDTYMSHLLDRLLAWAAALDCTVVLLSATLPKTRRAQLIEAFAGGPLPAEESAYPRLTAACGDGSVRSLPIPGTGRRSEVRLERLPPEELPARLRTAIAAGGCIAVICNTVGRAQELWTRLRTEVAADVPVLLFHARFPLAERLARERLVLDLFGPPHPDRRRPPRAIVVATQVIEQSLDLDFDLMCTEHAPLDLLLQRCGRLQRHFRNAAERPLGEPRLILLEPRLDESELPEFGASKLIYSEYVLLRSRIALRGRERWCLPDDIEELVEATYAEGDPAGESPAWTAAIARARAEDVPRQTERELKAEAVTIPLPNGPDDLTDGLVRDLAEDDPNAHPTLRAETRLSGPSVTAVVLYRVGDGWFFDAGGREPVPKTADGPAAEKKIVERTVNLSDFAVVRRLLGDDPASAERIAAWRDAKSLRHLRILPLDERGEFRCGTTLVRSDPELGIVYDRGVGTGETTG